jgi:hypothetical protein
VTATEKPKATATAAVEKPPQEPAFKKMFAAKAEYDYTGNTDAELSFKVGDEIVVYQDDIPGGWWLGEHAGKIGHAPAAYLKKIDEAPATPAPVATAVSAPASDTTAVTKPVESTQAPAAAATTTATTTTEKTAEPEVVPAGAIVVDPEGQLPQCPFHAKALYDYTPVSDAELPLKVNEEFRVVGYAQLGWCTAEKDSKLGHVPRGWISPIVNAVPAAPPAPKEVA